MTKRENALRQFVDKYGEKLSGKEVFEAFDYVWDARAEVTRSSDEQIAAALAFMEQAAAALAEDQALDIPAKMQEVDLDPKAYASDGSRIRNALVKRGVLEYEPAKAARYVKRIANGNAS